VGGPPLREVGPLCPELISVLVHAVYLVALVFLEPWE
jgi:hypothetical protein